MFVLLRDLLLTLFRVIFTKRKDIICALLLLKKENEILMRHLHLQKKGIKTRSKERFSLSLICAVSRRVFRFLSLAKPGTLLAWQRRFIEDRWSYKRRKPERKGVPKSTEKLVLEMKKRRPALGLQAYFR